MAALALLVELLFQCPTGTCATRVRYGVRYGVRYRVKPLLLGIGSNLYFLIGFGSLPANHSSTLAHSITPWCGLQHCSPQETCGLGVGVSWGSHPTGSQFWLLCFHTQRRGSPPDSGRVVPRSGHPLLDTAQANWALRRLETPGMRA